MKKIQSDTESQLVVTVRSPLAAWVGALGLFFLADFLRTLYTRSHEHRLIGLAGALVTCALFFLVGYEKCTFSFDRRTCILTWARQRGFWKRTSILPFASINNVTLQSCLGNDRYYPKHRIVLLTSEGELPLSTGYEHDDMNQTIAERMREVLGRAAPKLVEDSVASLVASGRTLDAIRLLREKNGMSLTEAHSAVAKMKEGKGPATGERY